MKTNLFTEVESTIKALNKELQPVFDEVVKLKKVLKDFNVNNIKQHPLTNLIPRITKTARRHDFDEKVKTTEGEYTIGTNHQGLGYQESYSSQLTSLSGSAYWRNIDGEQTTRDILFNDEAVISLTSIVKKSNQKTLLRIVKILKKYNLTKAFQRFKDKNINEISVNIENTDYKISIDLSRNYGLVFNLMKDEEKITGISIQSNNKKPSLILNDEDDILLKTISKHRYNDIDISELKTGFLIAQHTKTLIEAIKSKVDLLNGVKNDYTSEHDQLNDLLQPFLALEKL